MSRHGPAPTTRLVPYAHSRFMNRDGTRCRVGVRRLAEDTGLDKSTVAQHRATAIQLGWLIAMKRRLGQGCGELLPAAPDAVVAEQDAVLSADSAHANRSQMSASGTDQSTVRIQTRKCPAAADRSSAPIGLLTDRTEALRQSDYTKDGRPFVTRETLKDRIREWMMRDPSVPKYLSIGDTESLKMLVPMNLRAFHYEEVIEFLAGEFFAGRFATLDSGIDSICDRLAPKSLHESEKPIR